MSLRTKILLSICAINVVVLLLLTLNLWVDAATRAQNEMHRNAEFLTRLVADWLGEGEEGSTNPLKATHPNVNWGKVASRLGKSALVSSYVIAGHTEVGLKIYATSDPDTGRILRLEQQPLSEVLVQKRTIVEGSRVYTRVDTVYGHSFAARFDLSSAAMSASAVDLKDSMMRVLWIMGLGTALMLIVTYVLLNRFVLRPLDSLGEASSRVADGDFSSPIQETTGYDEMARMIQAFNLMMHKVAEHHMTLEDEIRKAKVRITDTEKRLFAAQRLSTTGTLAAGIAHEINNPLGGMLNALHAVRRTELTGEKREEYLALIGDGLARIKDIVAKVLQFSPKSLEPAPVRLRQVAERSAAFLDHRLQKKGVACANEIDPELPAVRGDTLELQQAFLNILLNAVDAVEPGEGRITITSETAGADAVRVSIADNGCGMTEEQIQRCLDPFYSTKEVGRGTGLGLSIANNIVGNHGGRLEIQAAEGKGTTVSMVFPVMKEARVRP